MTIVFIIIAVFAGALAGMTAACIMAAGAIDDAFRAGCRAGRVEAQGRDLAAEIEEISEWDGEGAGDG